MGALRPERPAGQVTIADAEVAASMHTVALVRWAGVLVGVAQAILINTPRPVGGLAGVGALSTLMAAYNVVAMNARRLDPRLLRRLQAIFLTLDFVVCMGWTLLLANDAHTTSYVVYVLVGIEAAYLYGTRGAMIVALAITAASILFFTVRHVAFGYPVGLASALFRTVIPITSTIFAGLIVQQSRRHAVLATAAGAEARRTAEELASLLRAISEIGEGVVVVEGRRIVQANDAFVRLSGYSLEELRSIVSFYDLLPETDPQEVGSGGHVPLRAESGESTLLTKSGERVPFEWSGRLVDDDAGHTRLVVVVRDARERLAALAEITWARDEAQRATRAKTEYLARMSHELRTPLTAILGFTELLALENPRLDQLSAIEAVSRSGAHLRALIDDVLDISRIESGAYDLTLEAVDALAASEEAAGLLDALATARGITVTTPDRTEGAVVHVLADRQGLMQVLVNLVSNAIKYNVEAGSVDITVTASGPSVCIAVADTGVGIPTDLLGSIFEPFQRLNAHRLTVEGTGLGLALVRELVGAMNGRVEVSSTVGQGSLFQVELPAAPPGAGRITANGQHPVTEISGDPPAETRPLHELAADGAARDTPQGDDDPRG